MLEIPWRATHSLQIIYYFRALKFLRSSLLLRVDKDAPFRDMLCCLKFQLVDNLTKCLLDGVILRQLYGRAALAVKLVNALVLWNHTQKV